MIVGWPEGCIACGEPITESAPSFVYCSDFCQEVGFMAYWTHSLLQSHADVYRYVREAVRRGVIGWTCPTVVCQISLTCH
jgi:hypothetical protein